MTKECGPGMVTPKINGDNGEGKLTLENLVSSALAGSIPRFSQIWPVRTGHELPAKIRVLRILGSPSIDA